MIGGLWANRRSYGNARGSAYAKIWMMAEATVATEAAIRTRLGVCPLKSPTMPMIHRPAAVTPTARAAQRTIGNSIGER